MARLIRLISALLVSQLALAVMLSAPTHALSSGSGTNEKKGFDTCTDPTPSQAQAFWNGSPYWWIGIYIGGIAMGCSQPNLSASYLNTLFGQGWQFEFIWVGPQPPGTGYLHMFSSDPNTAYTQGRNEASSAYAMLVNTLGVTGNAANTTLVYDIEAVNTSYQSAVNRFVQGWIDVLHLPIAQLAGVYGSVCGTNMNALASLSPPPDFVWGAWYNGNPSTSNLNGGGCGVSNGNWSNHQRLKQYVGGHNETWNRVTLNIDNDCANGPTDPQGGSVDPACP